MPLLLNQAKTEPLTLKDVELLNQDLGVFLIGIKWGILVVAIAIAWNVLCWVFDWDKFIPTLLLIITVIGYVAILVQSRNIRLDLRSKVKSVDTFYLEAKVILAYKEVLVDRDLNKGGGMHETKFVEVTVDQELLESLVSYKKSKQLPDFKSNERYEEMLRYDFKFKLKNTKGSIEGFPRVPIEDFVACTEKRNVKVWFAQRSKTIFHAEQLPH